MTQLYTPVRCINFFISSPYLVFRRHRVTHKLLLSRNYASAICNSLFSIVLIIYSKLTPTTLLYLGVCEVRWHTTICSTCCRDVIHAKSLYHILFVIVHCVHIINIFELMEMHIFNKFFVLVRRGIKCTPFYVIALYA